MCTINFIISVQEANEVHGRTYWTIQGQVSNE